MNRPDWPEKGDVDTHGMHTGISGMNTGQTLFRDYASSLLSIAQLLVRFNLSVPEEECRARENGRPPSAWEG